MTRKYTELDLHLPGIADIHPDTGGYGSPGLKVTFTDCDQEVLLGVIRTCYENLRKMEGNTVALEKMVSDVLYHWHPFADVVACARHIEQEMSL